jgi:glycosyltransferase involved in cell wall biosynthesis
MRQKSASSKLDSPLKRGKIVAAIPCYNTQNNISDVITGTKKFVDEVIVINDGSTDETARVAETAGAKVISHKVNKGYGGAIQSCFSAGRDSGADILVIIDGDGQHDPDELPNVLTPISQNKADLVIGSRFIAKGKKMPGYRKLGISLINFLWNFGSKVQVTDTQSGFRGYNKKFLDNIQLSEMGMGISIEILEKARKMEFSIEEVAITCSYESNNSTFSNKAFRHGAGVALSTLKIRFKSCFTNYNGKHNN